MLEYNAGANSINNPSVLSRNELLNDFKVNVAGALLSTQQVIPEMTERKNGNILSTGGTLALNPVPSRASASISKAGLRNLTFTLPDELAPDPIHVATVTIGVIVKTGLFLIPTLSQNPIGNFILKEIKRGFYISNRNKVYASRKAHYRFSEIQNLPVLF